MFIKKDQRKIDEILADDEDERTSLKLSKRPSEFQGSVEVLCRQSKIASLSRLRFLNLYENSLSNLQGIGLLSQTPLEEINLGCNKLSTIPLEVAKFIIHWSMSDHQAQIRANNTWCSVDLVKKCSNYMFAPGNTSITSLLIKFGSLKELKTLWLDDNQLSDFRVSLCQLDSLTTLRLSGNDLSYIPSSISSLQLLEVLVSTFSRIVGSKYLRCSWRCKYVAILPSHAKFIIILIVISVTVLFIGSW